MHHAATTTPRKYVIELDDRGFERMAAALKLNFSKMLVNHTNVCVIDIAAKPVRCRKLIYRQRQQG